MSASGRELSGGQPSGSQPAGNGEAVVWLERRVPARPDRPAVGGPDHPMRKVTRQVAFQGAWDAQRARKVGALFDELAGAWQERETAERLDAVGDALARGVPGGGRCLELGCGTGHATPVLARHFAEVVAVDLSAEMLRRAAAARAALWVRADASRLPLRRGWADALVLVNMLLFPEEVARVLAPGGRLVYVSSLGDATPIYLPPEDVVRALPGTWRGVAAHAGWGTWCAVSREGGGDRA